MLDYEVKIYPVIEDGKTEYYAECPELRGCAGQGATVEDAIQELKENMDLWLETAKETGIPIPAPKNYSDTNDCSGRVLARLPKSLHRKLKDRAEREGVSLNTLVVSFLSAMIERNSDGIKGYPYKSYMIDLHQLNTFLGYNSNNTINLRLEKSESGSK